MLRRFIGIFAVGLMAVFLLAGCGDKSQKDVVKDLGKKVSNMKGYQAETVMTFQHGDKEQTYTGNIWYKAPDFYKVVIQDESRENTTMIVKNKDGVFVMTPALNKKYRFKSKWPNDRSQYYLYQSLVKDIAKDAGADFEKKGNQYSFTTKTNYPTRELSSQEIVLNASSLAPVSAKVMNEDNETVINVDFKKFKFNPSFKKDTFDADANMTSAKTDVETAARPAEETGLQLFKPTIELPNTKLEAIDTVGTGSEKKNVIQYEGDKGFTLVEKQSEVAATSATVTLEGEPVDLGFTFGRLNGSMLTWTKNGTDFYLASDKLSADELVAVAKSVSGQVVK